MHNRKKKGFTLTEVIVVMAAIGILSGVVLANFGSGASAKKKNTQAVADLMSIKSALENYYAKNSRYPSSTAGAAQSLPWDGYCRPVGQGDSLGGNWIPNLPASYFPSGLPIEPMSKAAGNCTSGGANNTRQYIYNSDGYDYKLLYLEPQSMDVSQELIDPQRPTRAYGFWTEGAKTW